MEDIKILTIGGRPATELTKEELLIVLTMLQNEIESLRKMYYDAQKFNVDLMKEIGFK